MSFLVSLGLKAPPPDPVEQMKVKCLFEFLGVFDRAGNFAGGHYAYSHDSYPTRSCLFDACAILLGFALNYCCH